MSAFFDFSFLLLAALLAALSVLSRLDRVVREVVETVVAISLSLSLSLSLSAVTTPSMAREKPEACREPSGDVTPLHARQKRMSARCLPSYPEAAHKN